MFFFFFFFFVFLLSFYIPADTWRLYNIPADTWRLYNVASTSMQRHENIIPISPQKHMLRVHIRTPSAKRF